MHDPSSIFSLNNFNNISKSLSVSFYVLRYAGSDAGVGDRVNEELQSLNQHYNETLLCRLLVKVAEKIEARVLFSSKQKYSPVGASAVTLLEESATSSSPYVRLEKVRLKKQKTARVDSQLLHLDKSHFAVHTYPEAVPSIGISSIRLDFDLATCGNISPLSALSYCIEAIDPEIAVVDYRMRGYTRDEDGDKHYQDYIVESFANVIDKSQMARYEMKEQILPKNHFYWATLKRRVLTEKQLGKSLQTIGKQDKRKAFSVLANEIDSIVNMSA